MGFLRNRATEIQDAVNGGDIERAADLTSHALFESGQPMTSEGIGNALAEITNAIQKNKR